MYLYEINVATVLQPNKFPMASVKILLYTTKTYKDGSHPIVIQLIKDRKRKLMTIGSALPDEWDFESQLPNNRHSLKKELKGSIKRKKNAVERAIIELDDRAKPYSLDDIIDKLGLVKQSTSFKGYSNKLIEQLKSAKRFGNARAYTDAQTAFLAFNKGKDIDLSSITQKKLIQFEESLETKGLRVNSISVYLRTIRAIYNKAIKEELVNENHYPFKNFKIRKETTVKRALAKEDIKSILEHDLGGNPDLELARDIFLFSFYNRGMSFIDICYLTNRSVNGGRIAYRRKKTKQVFSIKLTNEAKKIIEKYAGGEPSNHIFPILKKDDEYKSYRTGIRILNKHLKKIGTDLELETPLTSYVARHSWATIAKRSGIPTAVISEGLGHDSELTTQIYLDSFENETLDNANEVITSLMD